MERSIMNAGITRIDDGTFVVSAQYACATPAAAEECLAHLLGTARVQQPVVPATAERPTAAVSQGGKKPAAEKKEAPVVPAAPKIKAQEPAAAAPEMLTKAKEAPEEAAEEPVSDAQASDEAERDAAALAGCTGLRGCVEYFFKQGLRAKDVQVVVARCLAVRERVTVLERIKAEDLPRRLAQSLEMLETIAAGKPNGGGAKAVQGAA